MAAVDVNEPSTASDIEVHTAVLKKEVIEPSATVADTTPTLSKPEVTYLS